MKKPITLQRLAIWITNISNISLKGRKTERSGSQHHIHRHTFVLVFHADDCKNKCSFHYLDHLRNTATAPFCSSLFSLRVHCRCFRLENGLLNVAAPSVCKKKQLNILMKIFLHKAYIAFTQTCVDKFWRAISSSVEKCAFPIDVFRPLL